MQPFNMGPMARFQPPVMPNVTLRDLLLKQRKTGRLPVEALQNLGRQIQGNRFPHRAVSRFFDAGGSRFGGLSGNPGSNFQNTFPDDPSSLGDTSQSPTLGNPSGPTPDVYFNPTPPPGTNVWGAPLLPSAGIESPVVGRGSGATSPGMMNGMSNPMWNQRQMETMASALVNPAAKPDTRMQDFRTLAQLAQRNRGMGSINYRAM